MKIKNIISPKEILGLDELSSMESGKIQGGRNKEKCKEKNNCQDVEPDIDIDQP